MSFGETRTIRFSHDRVRQRGYEHCKLKYELELPHGSVYVMQYPTNEFFLHQIIEKPDNSEQCRISLTWRVVIPAY